MKAYAAVNQIGPEELRITPGGGTGQAPGQGQADFKRMVTLAAVRRSFPAKPERSRSIPRKRSRIEPLRHPTLPRLRRTGRGHRDKQSRATLCFILFASEESSESTATLISAPVASVSVVQIRYLDNSCPTPKPATFPHRPSPSRHAVNVRLNAGVPGPVSEFTLIGAVRIESFSPLSLAVVRLLPAPSTLFGPSVNAVSVVGADLRAVRPWEHPL